MQALKGKPLKLIQITDLHYCAEPGAVLHSDVITDDSLNAVLEHIHHYEPHTRAIIATGDLTQDPVESAYQRLSGALNNVHFPVYALPGNHDDPELAQSILEGGLTQKNNLSMPKIVTLGDWALVLMDSTIYGQAHGHLNEAELALLEETLERHPAEHVLICLHHHPLAIDSAWMDRLMLDNAEELFSVIDRFDKVRGVVFGHIHQDFQQQRNGVHYIGSPATCIQWVPQTGSLEIDQLPPAYRRLTLQAGGQIDTEVVYLEHALRASA